MLKFLFSLLSKSESRSLTDEQIVDEYLKTQKEYYFELLYYRYSSKIFGKCVTLLREEHLAKDATQDIIMKVLMNLSRFSGKAKISTWIYSISYNHCIDVIRRNKKESEDPYEDLNQFDFVEETDDKILFELRLDQLKQALNLIPVVDKSVLMMKYMDGMSIKEIAEVVQKSESAIKMKIKRAKMKVMKEYNEDLVVLNEEYG